MTASLRIADVASQADISTATIRYYERVGVLPTPERAANGYRTYDESTVERLGFVSRAKQLGCTLDEIVALSAAWEAGSCGPLQDGLQELVAEKLDATHNEIAKLTVLSTELTQAARTLADHRPDGACDDQCGCLNAAAPSPTPKATPLSLTAKPLDGSLASCTLEPSELPTRVDQWKAVVAQAHSHTEISGGLRLDFGQADITPLAQLVAAEQDCCGFFSFQITVDERGVGLETSGPPDALHAVQALLGDLARTG